MVGQAGHLKHENMRHRRASGRRAETRLNEKHRRDPGNRARGARLWELIAEAFTGFGELRGPVQFTPMGA